MLVTLGLFVFTTDLKNKFFFSKSGQFHGSSVWGLYTFQYPGASVFLSLKPQPYPIAWPKSLPSLTYLLFLFKIYVVDVQHCVNFCCIAVRFSYSYVYILFHILFHYGLSRATEHSSLCCTAEPCHLCIRYVIVCIC